MKFKPCEFHLLITLIAFFSILYKIFIILTIEYSINSTINYLRYTRTSDACVFTVVAHSVWALPIKSLNSVVLSNRDASPIFSCERVECDKCRARKHSDATPRMIIVASVERTSIHNHMMHTKAHTLLSHLRNDRRSQTSAEPIVETCAYGAALRIAIN